MAILSTFAIQTGKTVVFKASFYDSQSNLCQAVGLVTWSTTNPNIVSYVVPGEAIPNKSNAAKISGISPGTATITASSTDQNGNPITTSVVVTVYNNAPTSMGINQVP